MSPPLLITYVVLSVASVPWCFSADQQYEECQLPLRCGSGLSVFPNITYPFWGNNIGKPRFCGKTEFELSCKDNQTLTLEIKNVTLRVISVNLDSTIITVADESLFEGRCPKILNFSGDDQFIINHNTNTIDLFECPRGLDEGSTGISCNESNGSLKTYNVFGLTHPPQNCSKVGEIPMLSSAEIENTLHQSKKSNQTLKMALEKGFELRYTIDKEICRFCYSSSGICGSEVLSGRFQCLCADKPFESSCQYVQG